MNGNNGFRTASQIAGLRVGLLLVFLFYPLIFMGTRFFDAFVNPFANAGNFFFVIAALTALLATFTLKYQLGYLTFLGVMLSNLVSGTPLIFFTSHLAIALTFAEGTSSLGKFVSITQGIREGPAESVTLNLQTSFRRFRRVLFGVGIGLFILSAVYGILPDLMPATAELSSLAIYATIGLMAIAVTVLYLGSRE